jgi:hypothetical protein
MVKYVIRITRLGAAPILGVVEHSEDHARRLCEKHKGWEMVAVGEKKNVS